MTTAIPSSFFQSLLPKPGKIAGASRASKSKRAAADGPLLLCPFVVLIDSHEQTPFSFNGLTADANENNRPLLVKSEVQHLGDGRGDYTIKGLTASGVVWHELVALERKSIADCQSTILGWGRRRENFERELAWLNSIESAAIVVEGTIGEVLRTAPEHGKKSAAQNAKSIFRSVLSWKIKYPKVQWEFCDGRRLAEVCAFRKLEMYWRMRTHVEDEMKKAAKKAAQMTILPTP